MSSYVIAASEALATAASDLTGIGSAIEAANAAAAGSTTQVAAAAADEVSAAIASLFGGYAQQYQAMSAQTTLFHQQFAQALSAAGLRYMAAEAVNASPLQMLENGILGVINAPTNALFGRPLIGNGTDGAAGTGQAGGAGGVLIGNGGNGGGGGTAGPPPRPSPFNNSPA
ncbi:PE family protein, partial [Mycobacterium simulans]|uniref:PE family protein n=1 Tax=Mycobacterium simulans TaxID=627089 RepID=UPI00174A8C8A